MMVVQRSLNTTSQKPMFIAGVERRAGSRLFLKTSNMSFRHSRYRDSVTWVEWMSQRVFLGPNWKNSRTDYSCLEPTTTSPVATQLPQHGAHIWQGGLAVRFRHQREAEWKTQNFRGEWRRCNQDCRC